MHLAGRGGMASFVKQHTALEVKQFGGVELNLGTLLYKCRCLCMRHNQGDPRGLIQTSTPHSYHQKCWEAQCRRLCVGWLRSAEMSKVSPAISKAMISKASLKSVSSTCSLATPSSRVYLSRCSHKQYKDSACVQCFICFCTSFSEHWGVDKKVGVYRSQPTSSATDFHWIWTKMLGHLCHRKGFLLASRLGLSLPFVFVLVTLLNKSTSGFRRTFIFMPFFCISLSNYSWQYGHFYTSDILLPFCLPFPCFSLQLKHLIFHQPQEVEE